jgi:GTP-binding protein
MEGVWEEAPHYFVTSSSNGMGQEELLGFIDNLNSNFFKAIN